MGLTRVLSFACLIGAVWLLPWEQSRAQGGLDVASSPHVSVIGADELVSLVWQQPNTVLIDARNPADRKYGYIEGSANLSNANTDCDSLSKIADSKTTPVAVYCNGGRCERSEIAISIALKCGYQNLYWFKGGFVEWKNARFPYVR